MTDYPKKLIEVALPLDDINAASAKEKYIRTGHPSLLHLWWSRKPLATSRAVLFAQLVNDPGGKRGWGDSKGQSKVDAQNERERLFQLMRDLTKWENINNEDLLKRAHEEIKKSWDASCRITDDDPNEFPPFIDPFSGGGSIPLEAQRLDLEANASDLNPVSVLITKALIEIPPRFAGMEPIGPIPKNFKQNLLAGVSNDWSGGKGLAEDISRYGALLYEKMKKSIGHFYPEVDLPKEDGGGKTEAIAWLWVRRVPCPNPACQTKMPLTPTFFLSKKKGRLTWLEPQVNYDTTPPIVDFFIRKGACSDEKRNTIDNGSAFINDKGKKVKATFTCLSCQQVINGKYINDQANNGNMSTQLIAVVAKGKKGRVYCLPNKSEWNKIEKQINDSLLNVKSRNKLPKQKCRGTFASNALGRRYGFHTFSDYFTSRQLFSLAEFGDQVLDIRENVITDALKSDWQDDKKKLADGGSGPIAYADAITVFLTLAIDRLVMSGNSIVRWNPVGEKAQHSFGMQSIAMAWNFAEPNFLGSATGSLKAAIKLTAEPLQYLGKNISKKGNVLLSNASVAFGKKKWIISTDPPYYDNVIYADLADFFYVWNRLLLKEIYPELFATLLTPKKQELVATPYRHKNKKEADEFFMEGMKEVLQNMARSCHSAFPVTLYYAFKQSETKQKGTVSPGWESFLNAVIKAPFIITGTWPIRTEMKTRQGAMGANSLASSIVLVCRKRPSNSSSISRKQFLRELDVALPEALKEMIGGTRGASPIAPVDLAQAAIGPGMAVFSQYDDILEADGSPMSVHNALIIINKAIDEYFTHAESDMDSDTRFCVDWFLQYGFTAAAFGDADVLARAKGTTVDGVEQAGVVESGAGKVRLLRKDEYPEDWDPTTDKRTPIWEACHHLCRTLKISETEAGSLLAKMPEKGEPIRQLAYRLYTQCERKGWSEDARVYNELITSWSAILEESRKTGHRGTQMELFE